MSSPSSAAEAPPPPRRPGRPRNPLTEQTVLEATFAEVSQTGLAGLSVDRVAARAGVSKATIYRRWPTKAALVIDAWRSATEVIDVPDTGSLRSDLEAMDRLYAEKMNHEEFLRLLPEFVAARQHDAELDRLFTAFVADASAPVVAVVQRAIDRGEVADTIDPYLAAEVITGPVFYSMLMHGHFVDPVRMGQLLDLALNGLLGAGR